MQHRPRLGAILALAGAALIVASLVYLLGQAAAWDAPTYLAAGERLNAGHALYALGPGDRPVLLNPPYWTVPLLSPPPIAVLWRPIALLGWNGMVLWWAVCVSAISGVIVALAVRAPSLTGPALLVLSIPIAWEIGSANVNGLLIAGTVVTWLLARRGHDRAAGALVAGMTALKVWPAFLMLWFAVQRRWGAVGGFLVAGVAIAVGSVLGAGLNAHLEYLSIARAIYPSELSIAGLLAGIGISVPWIGYVLAFLCALAIVRWRARPSETFGLAVATIVLASPVLYINGYALLIAALAPFAWPLASTRTPATEVVPTQPGELVQIAE
jgi:hypothetical protein